MYEFVTEKEIAPYRSSCSKDMVKLRDRLKQKYDIVTQFSLVGSGSHSRNLVTRNGNAPFDLDYNLQILSMPNQYWKDLRLLKEKIRQTMNEVVGNEWFSDAKDSTSVITAILHFKNSPQVEFSFDVAVLAKNQNGDWCRLVHNKNAWGLSIDQYTWNEVPNSHNVRKKADAIKDELLWNEVRDTYLRKKNDYLQKRDLNHPSFNVYVEAVNEVYNKYFR